MSMFDMMGMMGKAKELQSKMQEVQSEMGGIIENTELGNVRVRVNGRKEVIAIEVQGIDPLVLQQIVSTLNVSLRDVESKTKALMAEKTEGIMPKIPGLDLGNMFK